MLITELTYLQTEKVYPCCYRKYDGFMILCETCSLWFHGLCVGVSFAMAKKIKKYVCTVCILAHVEPTFTKVCFTIAYHPTHMCKAQDITPTAIVTPPPDTIVATPIVIAQVDAILQVCYV